VVAFHLGKWFLGMPPLNDRALPEKRRWTVAAYGVAAMVYRVFVVVLILWFCYRVLQPYGLAAVAQVLALVVAVGLVLTPAWGLIRLGRDPRWRGRIKVRRVLLSSCGLVVVLAAVALVPLPHRIVVPAVIGPKDAQRVYVSVRGTVAEAVAAGERVERGQLVARLANLELRRQVERLRGQRDQQQFKLRNLELRLADDPSVASQIPTAREALKDVEKRLRDRERDEQRLQLSAPAAGTVLPPPQRARSDYTDNDLATWCGSPLEKSNRGCLLETGTLFCLVGDAQLLDGRLVVGQAHIQDVRRGQRVRIRLDQLPGAVVSGRITEISQTPLEVAPPELAGTGRLAVLVDEDGVPRPADPSYEARVDLDDASKKMLIGTSGYAKVYAAPQTLGTRLVRMIKRTFHFEL
jgi:putative peptide zinc metalloprotease protein